MPAGLGPALLIVAVILFILAAVPFPDAYQNRLIAAGLAFFAAAHAL